MPRRKPCWLLLGLCRAAAFALAVWWGASGPAVVRADEPLHERIDRAIESAQVVPAAPPASDAEFIRRASLDLIGRIPSVAEVRAFLDDQAPTKREALVDRLLVSPEYARHMAQVFDVMLMERRPEKHVKLPEWQGYLYDSFAANKPYDQLAREIIGADGVDPALRPAARFFLDREGEANLLVRDVGRIFLGVDMQCAQCHDHPLIADYYQADYQGLYAFFNRSFLLTDKDVKKVVVGEKADGEVNFQSVFDATKKGTALPKLPGGEPIPEPTFAKGQEYEVAPADNVRPVPKYSRRAQLAKAVAGGQSRAFDRNIANRLWAHLMGRGLVDPVDLHHDGNPPSHPAVLELLADAFGAMKYDIKVMLRELALTRAYGRSIDLAPEMPARGAQLESQLAVVEAERAQAEAAARQAQEAAGKVGAELAAARATMAPVADELAKAQAAVAEAKKNADAAGQAVTAAQNALPAKQDAAQLVAEAGAKTLEATTKLPDDKELADAAAKLKTRAEQLTAEVAALAKTVTDGQATMKTAAEQAAAQEPVAAAAAVKVEPLKAQVAALAEHAKAADAKQRGAAGVLVQIAARIEDAKAIVGYAHTLAAVSAARTNVEKADADLAAARQAVAAFQPQVDQAAQALTAAGQAATAAGQAVEEARKAHADRKSTADAVAEALAKTEVALAKLPQSAELAQAVQLLKTKADQSAADAKAAETQIAERETAAKTVAERAAAAKQASNNVAAQVAPLAASAQAAEQAAAAARQKADAQLAAAADARREVAERASARCAAATLKPLTPEQLAMSMMQAAGVVDRERAAVEAEWNKNHPTPDEAAQKARPREIDQVTSEKLKPGVAAFVALFAAAPGQPQQSFAATVDQALFLANGGQVRGWLAPAEGNLADRLAKLAEPVPFAAELYLAVLSRTPAEAETADVTALLANRAADRAAAAQELIWALFCSAEFRFNH
ncbi:MAG: DUF1549 domain-containing protein [Planctomycetia bacterium]|nr:DUF1549 domain-containing protein [Planctomycetia bacterium]